MKLTFGTAPLDDDVPAGGSPVDDAILVPAGVRPEVEACRTPGRGGPADPLNKKINI